MLNEVPPTQTVEFTSAEPAPLDPWSAPEEEEFHSAPLRSPRRSPRKVSHKVRGNGALMKADKKTTRVLRRSSGLGPLSPKRQTKVIPAFETEVIPSTSASIPEFKLSMTPSKTQLPPMTSAFVLPPPSPAASFNPQDALLSSAFAPPISQFDIPTALEPSIPLSQSDDIVTRPPPSPVASSSMLPSSSSAPNLGAQEPPSINVPNTPSSRRPFPMAKPLASRMIHAYSPVKPSPLSRILMLANSPDSPENLVMPSLDSVSEDSDIPGVSPTPGQPLLYGATKGLAAGLGVSDDDDAEEEVPLREKKVKHHNTEQKVATKDKGKARADDRRIGTHRSRTAADALEKENKVKRSRPDDKPKISSGAGVVKNSSRATSTSKTTSTTMTQPKIVPKIKGGARRVPIDSAEAAVVAPAWKG